jgi:hypothetical protein
MSPVFRTLSSIFRARFAAGAAVVLGSAWLCASWDSAPQSPAPAAVPERVRARVPARASRVPDVAATPGQPARDVAALQPIAAAVPAVDYSYSNLDPRARDRKRYAAAELAVLEEVIALNGLTEASSSGDYDDGDGVLEPLEFGTQVWCGGHLRELYAGPSEYASFGYELRQLPARLGDLRELTRLSLNSNQLAELPTSIGELEQLRILELYDNRLRALPDSIGNLLALEVLQVRGNELGQLPASLADLPRLRTLFFSDNPLSQVPDELRELAQGALAPDPRVVRRNVDCSPES